MISPLASKKLLEVVPAGSTILELGTGFGTKRLTDHFNVISIENDIKWHQGVSELIEVPLAEITKTRSVAKRFPEFVEWYDPEILAQKLEGLEYDAIVVDGPATPDRRPGFYQHRELFKKVPVLFDDVNRVYDIKTATMWARYVDARSFEVFDFTVNKQFALVLPC